MKGCYRTRSAVMQSRQNGKHRARAHTDKMTVSGVLKGACSRAVPLLWVMNNIYREIGKFVCKIRFQKASVDINLRL